MVYPFCIYIRLIVSVTKQHNTNTEWCVDDGLNAMSIDAIETNTYSLVHIVPVKLSHKLTVMVFSSAFQLFTAESLTIVRMLTPLPFMLAFRNVH